MQKLGVQSVREPNPPPRDPSPTHSDYSRPSAVEKMTAPPTARSAPFIADRQAHSSTACSLSGTAAGGWYPPLRCRWAISSSCSRVTSTRSSCPSSSDASSQHASTGSEATLTRSCSCRAATLPTARGGPVGRPCALAGASRAGAGLHSKRKWLAGAGEVSECGSRPCTPDAHSKAGSYAWTSTGAVNERVDRGRARPRRVTPGDAQC